MPPEFSTTTNWQPTYRQKFEAVIITSQPLTYTPIPNFFIPIQLSAKYVAIGTESDSANTNWRTAGHIGQLVSTGLFSEILPDAQVSASYLILLRGVRVFQFNQYSSTYSIYVRFHKWIRDITITLWQYIGTE
jgi:hypothetical protein